MIQYGGQGQNSNPLPAPLTLIQTHTNKPLPSMSSQLVTGVWHPSYLLKPNLQLKDSCGGKVILCFWHIGTPPVCKAWRQSLKAKHSAPTLSWNMLEVTPCVLCVRIHTSQFHWGRYMLVKSRWIDGEGRGLCLSGYVDETHLWQKEEYLKGQTEKTSNKKSE